MIVLGIESSCDETAAALVADGRVVLGSVIASQVEVHHPYGGIVPELASRRHLEAIEPVVNQALSESGLGLDAVQGIAATQGPGLVGSLLVGFSFAKALAFALEVPWVGVDHLEAHVQALFLEDPVPEFPIVVLLASGGHTGLYLVSDHTRHRVLGRTRDDAAGEAFDKVAKMMALGYPGGAAIDRLARQGDPARIRFTRPFLDKGSFDFSFSGIKTAVARYIREHENHADHLPDIAAGFQEAVVDVLVLKLLHAARETGCARVGLAGGVAANGRLRERLRAESGQAGLECHIPAPALCGDNAAMVAASGFHLLGAGRRGSLEDDVYPRSM
jgi:N6-L-threonylcarbamoyladenine synthase